MPKYSLEAARARAASDSLASRIRAHLELVGPADREILYHRYVLRKTAAEISGDLDIPVERVNQVLEQARRG
jgi:DNA-directed RNA polymerase specialized sigma24 family protein